MTEVIKEYQTVNMTEAAALHVKGCRYAAMPAGDYGNKCIFILYNVPRNLLEDYEQGQLEHEVNSFHEAVKRLSAAAKRVIAAREKSDKKAA